MVSGSAVVGIAVVALVLVLIPGPNMIYLISRSVSQGRRAGLISLAGIASGLLIYLFAAAAGLSEIFTLVPTLYLTVKVAGAIYLLWLAWNIIRNHDSVSLTSRALPVDKARQLFAMGMATSLLNPKAAILYASLLPQFVDPRNGHVGEQTLELGLAQLSVGLTVNGTIVVAAAALATTIARRPLWIRIQRYLTATALAAFAIRIATEPSHTTA